MDSKRLPLATPSMRGQTPSVKARAWVMDVGAGRRVAAGTHHVVEYLLSPETIDLPLAPVHCPALLIWREQIIPSIDLTRLSPSREPAKKRVHGAVILAYQEAPGMPVRYGALLVHSAPEETWVSNDMACPVPDESAVLQHFTCACFAHRDEAIPVLDAARLFSEPLPWTPTSHELRAENAAYSVQTTPAGDSSPTAGDAANPVEAAEPVATTPTADVSPTAADAQNLPEQPQTSGQQRVPQIIEETLSAIHDETALKRVLFGVLTQDRRSVRAHFYCGVESDSPLREFRFERGGSGLFARLVTKPQHVWVHAGNRDRLTRLVSAETRELLSEGGFCAASIFVGSNLVGVCYGDDLLSEDGPDEQCYQQFKDFCNNMARRLREIAV